MTEVSGKRVVIVFLVVGVSTIVAAMAIYFAYAPEREKSRNITFDAGPIFGVMPPPVDAAPPPDGAAPAVPQGMILIPGTTLMQGSTDPDVEDALATCGFETKDACSRDRFEHEQPARRVIVSRFYLDRTEVTADAMDPTAHAHVGLPATGVTWTAAAAYCHAHGKRLPREVEWEAAARGGSRRAYPWGDDRPRCDGVVVARGPGMLCEIAGKGPAPVGSGTQDETPEGIVDLGGNVAEWVEDAFADYPPCDGCTDPVSNHTSPAARVVRGGAWNSLAAAARAAGRVWRDEAAVDEGIGFRCAKDAP